MAITFTYTETPAADDSYGEAVVTVVQDGKPIAKVVVFCGAGKSEERQGRPYLSIDVKPTAWRDWRGRFLSFSGAQSPDQNRGKPYITRRHDHDGPDIGHLLYTVVAEAQ
jgi:hypothetical protein